MSTKKIEDAIREHLTGAAQENALDFITHLSAKGAVFEDSDNYFWHPQYKGHGTIIINLEVSDEGASLDTFITHLPNAWENQQDIAIPVSHDTEVAETPNASTTFSATGSVDMKRNCYDAPNVDEREKEIIWKNVRSCEITGCGDCAPGINKVILGKEFTNLCGSFLGIYDPDAETFECMKKLVDELMSDIDG